MKNCLKAIIYISLFAFSGMATGQVPTPTSINTITHLQVKVDNISHKDSLTLIIYPNYMSEITEIVMPKRVITSYAANDGIFHFAIDSLNSPFYLSLAKGRRGTVHNILYALILENYLVEPGSNVTISIDSLYPTLNKMDVTGYKFNRINFSGKGSEIFNIQSEFDSLPHNPAYIKSEAKMARIKSNLPNNIKIALNTLEGADSIRLKKLSIIGKYRKVITPIIYQVFEADILSESWLSKSMALFGERTLYNDTLRNLVKSYREKHVNSAFDYYPDSIALISKNYAYSLQWFYQAAYALDSTARQVTFFNYLAKQKDSDEFKDKLLTGYLLYNFEKLNNSDAVFEEALAQISTPVYHNMLREMYNTLGPGSRTKNFTLPDIKGNMVSLKDFLGKVVFIDFWYTGCGYCASYYKSHLSTVEKRYAGNPNIVFISISVDDNKLMWLNSVEGGKYTSKEIINLYTDGKGTAHDIIRDYKVRGYPRPILIDQYGKIYSANSKDLRNKETLSKAIDALL